jgi:hypothetical protein
MSFSDSPTERCDAECRGCVVCERPQ